MTLENDMRDALRRVPAPEGFAERVMARVGKAERAPARAPWWRAVAATFLLTAILGGWGGHELLERRRERQGERAREQVLLALRIAGSKVARAQREVSRHIAR